MGALGKNLPASWAFIFAVLLSFYLPPITASAEALSDGWTMEKIVREEAEEGVYGGGPEYYALKPSDGRPAITVTAGEAKKLKAGQLEPEAIYVKSTKEKSASSSTEPGEYVYGVGAGVEQPDPIYSTAAKEFRPQGYVEEQEIASAKKVPPAQTSISGFSAIPTAGINNSSNSPVAKNYAPPTGGSAPFKNSTNGASAAVSAPSGTSTIASELEALKKDAETKISEAKKESAKEIQLNAGLPTDKNKSDAKTKGDGTKNVVVDIPPCVRTKKIYGTGGAFRVNVPLGCNHIMVSMWGAGGASKKEEYTSGRNQDTYYRIIPGKGGSYNLGNGDIDATKTDLVVVVGKKGGEFSALYSVPKPQGGTLQSPNNLLFTAKGGDGASREAGKSASGAPGSFQSTISENSGSSTGAFRYGQDRGSAGNSDTDGKVILEFF